MIRNELGVGALTFPYSPENDALMLAAMHADVDAGRRALADGADPNCLDAQGQTPLHHCAWNRCLPLMQSLAVDHGAAPDVVSKQGFTPLQASVCLGTSVK